VEVEVELLSDLVIAEVAFTVSSGVALLRLLEVVSSPVLAARFFVSSATFALRLNLFAQLDE